MKIYFVMTSLTIILLIVPIACIFIRASRIITIAASFVAFSFSHDYSTVIVSALTSLLLKQLLTAAIFI